MYGVQDWWIGHKDRYAFAAVESLMVWEPWGALQRGPGGPWPTQNFGWVGHNACGPTNNWPVCSKSELLLLAEYNIGPTIADISWFQEDDLRKQTHASVHDALATFLVLPATTASCERTFSELRMAENLLEVVNGSGSTQLTRHRSR